MAGDLREPRLGSRPGFRSSWDQPHRLFWIFVVVHVTVWTLLPTLLYTNLPLDCVEMHAWGQQWQWGYHKHPPVPAWITRALAIASGQSEWALYFGAAVCTASCFWAAWRLGREMVSPRAALLGAVLLECCFYYNFEATVLNNNTVLYAFWALSVVAFWQALRTDQTRSWIFLGVCFGLGLLSKYSMGILALCMLGFLLWHPRGRAVWRRPGPYLATATALAVFMPHLLWAFEHGFPSLQYAASRAHSQASWTGHILYPMRFLLAQALALLPMGLVCLPLTGFPWRRRSTPPDEQFQRDFLVAIGLAPLLLHLLLSGMLNIKLRSMWGSHLWTFAGLMLVFFLELRPAAALWRRVYWGSAVACGVFAAALAGRCIGATVVGHEHRETFPGRALARQVEAVWERNVGGQLPVAAGEEWLAGNVAFYGQSNAAVYAVSENDASSRCSQRCPWMDDGRFNRCGGVVVWNAEVENLSATVRERFPNVRCMDVLTIASERPSRLPPVQVAIAVIAPAAMPAVLSARTPQRGSR